jgi:hypothetical protein
MPGSINSDDFRRLFDINSTDIQNVEIDNMSGITMAPDSLSSVNDATIRSPTDMVEPSNTRSRVARCIITAFVPEAHERWLQPLTWFPEDMVLNWCGQLEECPTTERLHIHCYVEFKHAKRPKFCTIRNRIKQVTGKNGDVKCAKRSSARQRQGAVNYCLKDSGRLHGTNPFIWDHNHTELKSRPFEKSKTKKTKEDVVAEQVDYIESKPQHWTWNQILHESDYSKKLLAGCGWGAKYHAGRHEQAPRRTIKNVVVLYGCGGTGKTTMAQKWDVRDDEDFHERYYKRNSDDGKFWGGGRTAYRGQRVIHLEEFCGQETAANFKEICDIGKHGPSVNVKNGGGQLNHDTVVITSNHHPAGWYRKLFKGDPKQWTPIARRFTQVVFFPELRPDGSRNIPDEGNPPYYIDQTDLFNDHEFQREYEQALQHAGDVWPLPSEDLWIEGDKN